MSDKWKDVGPGGNILERVVDSATGGLLGDKRTVQNTENGEYREVCRGHGQGTGEAVEKGNSTTRKASPAFAEVHNASLYRLIAISGCSGIQHPDSCSLVLTVWPSQKPHHALILRRELVLQMPSAMSAYVILRADRSSSK